MAQKTELKQNPIGRVKLGTSKDSSLLLLMPDKRNQKNNLLKIKKFIFSTNLN